MTDDTRRRQFVIAAGTVLATGVAGCNSDGDSSTEGDPEDGSDPTATSGDTATPTATPESDGDSGTDGGETTGGTTEPTTDGSDGGGQQDLRQLSIGESAQGHIDEDDPSDPQFDALGEPVEFSASSGDTVRVSMQSEAFDAYLLLLGPDDDWIAENDDDGDGTNSQLTTELSADGTHTAWALSFSGDAVGSYTISISSA